MIVRNLPLIQKVSDSLAGKKAGDYNRSLFTFDPNTATPSELRQLGFTEKTTKTLLTFRNKGFKFRNSHDLLKVYGVSQELFEILKPYILFTSNGSAKLKPSTGRASASQVQNKEKVELNSADSTTLLSVSGIGPVFAKRILKYREILGGYAATDQLLEVFGLTEEHFKKIKDHVTVNSELVRKLHINSDEFKVINKHPYLSYEQTKDIFNFRRKSPITAGNLALVLKDEALAQKLKPYLLFD
jgi:competence protein ComEA